MGWRHRRRGSPARSRPPQRWGSTLIEHVLADDFRGKVEMHFEPQGLRCELTTKMSDLQYD